MNSELEAKVEQAKRIDSLAKDIQRLVYFSIVHGVHKVVAHKKENGQWKK